MRPYGGTESHLLWHLFFTRIICCLPVCSSSFELLNCAPCTVQTREIVNFMGKSDADIKLIGLDLNALPHTEMGQPYQILMASQLKDSLIERYPAASLEQCCQMTVAVTVTNMLKVLYNCQRCHNSDSGTHLTATEPQFIYNHHRSHN
jgi:hypothetical protein